MDYTPRELMVVAAAREIRDGDKIFVGMRLPLLGFAVAKEIYAPRAIGIFENGVIRDWPAWMSWACSRADVWIWASSVGRRWTGLET